MTVSDVRGVSLGPLAALPLPAVAVDRLGYVRAANPAAAELLQLHGGRFEGRLLESFFEEPSKRRVVDALLVPTPATCGPLGLETSEETRRMVELVLAPGGDVRICVLVEGTSEPDDVRRVRLGRLLEEIDQGVVAVDADLCVRFANRAAVVLLDGIDVDEALPERWRGFDLGPFARSLFERRAVSAEATVRVGTRLIRLGGIPAADGLALVLATDVTDGERREEAERDFVANAAHELLNPVAAIMSAADALELAGDVRDERRRFLEHIVRECHRLERVLRALLDLARMQYRGESPALEPVPLRELLTGVADRLRPAPQVDVSVLCPPALVVATNRALLDHALLNVAANAVRHTEAGQVRLAALATRRRVVIDVDDSGPGIATDMRARVLERFYRAGDTGTGAGLGLAIARQAVDALSGRLQLLDSPLGGTRARIVLPNVEAA
jgi:signal transduction histidine kinase